MPNRSKQKGNRFERQIVDRTKDYFRNKIKVQRAWGSNGAALGLHEEVDILIGKNLKLQAKCRKRIGQWMLPNENVDAQVIKEDRGEPLVVMKYEDWCELLEYAINSKYPKYTKNG